MLRGMFLTLVALTFLAACTIKDDPLAAPPDVAAPPANALKTASGLASKVLIVGLGTVRPNPQSSVTVNYVGWTTDGKMFDHGGPVTFRLTEVIPGWTEGLQLMVKAEKRRFWVPANLGYGDNPGGGMPSGMLVFDIELLEVR